MKLARNYKPERTKTYNGFV